MKLRRIGRTALTEGAKSDFYDLYLLLSSPYLQEPDNQALLADRTTDLCDYFATKLYQALVFRAEMVGDLDEGDDQDNRSYHELYQVRDPRERIAVVDRILAADSRKHRVTHDGRPVRNLIYHKAWLDIIQMLPLISFPPADPAARARLLDRFFAMSHNSGPVAEWMRLPWLEDALYVKALAHPNEIAHYASPEVVSATRSAATGTGYKPVTHRQYYDLYLAKKERGEQPGTPPVPDDYPPPPPRPGPRNASPGDCSACVRAFLIIPNGSASTSSLWASPQDPNTNFLVTYNSRDQNTFPPSSGGASAT